MVHSATLSAVERFVDALGVDLDLGIVRPGPEGERGSAFWRRRPLSRHALISALPRCAAENARGAAIYCRLHVEDDGLHPGVLMLDDLNTVTISRLKGDGLSPSAVVETSSGNFQCWIRLVPKGQMVERTLARVALLHLIAAYDADPRAASTVQPGRIPGFTNRKLKHRRPDGAFPFVRLTSASMIVAPEAPNLLATVEAALEQAQPRRPRGAPEKSFALAGNCGRLDLDAIRREQEARILDELAGGRRPDASASASEIDFATVVAALDMGLSANDIEGWLGAVRPEKTRSYPARTVSAAEDYRARRDASPGARR